MRNSTLVLCMLVAAITSLAYAEETTSTAQSTPTTDVTTVAPAPDAAQPAAPTPPQIEVPPPTPMDASAVIPAVSEPVQAPAATAPTPETLTDNLEFISGEVSAVDESAKTVSVRLYGDEGATAGEKILKVVVDETTDLTDGEKDRDLKSLTVGTEVDVEYDPTSSKATYIFVY
jgi:hypothetical protein